jgi:hypothetical protein
LKKLFEVFIVLISLDALPLGEGHVERLKFLHGDSELFAGTVEEVFGEGLLFFETLVVPMGQDSGLGIE